MYMTYICDEDIVCDRDIDVAMGEDWPEFASFDWVDDETLEGVIDGVYYKFVTEFSEGESSGLIGMIAGAGSVVGEWLAGSGTTWATVEQMERFIETPTFINKIEGFRCVGYIDCMTFEYHDFRI